MARIHLIGPDSDAKSPATGDETVENGWSFRKVITALNTMMAELYAGVTNALDATSLLTVTFTIDDDTVRANLPFVVPSFTVEELPESVAGGVIYVTNGAEGQPILAFGDGSDWRRCDTGDVVSVGGM